MPHAFNANPNHPAVPFLVRLHADLGGQILENRKEAKRLADAMMHVEAVIKIFDPDYSVRRIAPKRRQLTNPWFKRGTLFRAALNVLREATEPLTVAQTAAAVMTAKGIKDATTRQRQGIEAGIRSCLEKNAGKTVQRAGEGHPMRWSVTG
jgi:hypothetical protein